MFSSLGRQWGVYCSFEHVIALWKFGFVLQTTGRGVDWCCCVQNGWKQGWSIQELRTVHKLKLLQNVGKLLIASLLKLKPFTKKDPLTPTWYLTDGPLSPSGEIKGEEWKRRFWANGERREARLGAKWWPLAYRQTRIQIVCQNLKLCQTVGTFIFSNRQIDWPWVKVKPYTRKVVYVCV